MTLASASRQQIARQRADAIRDRRKRLMQDLAQLRQNGNSPLADNAVQLLTRWWGRSDWDARERLLTTAAWLISTESNRLEPNSPAKRDGG